MVMTVFVGLLLFLGFGFDAAAFSAEGVFLPIGTAAALLWGGGTAAYSFFNGDRAVLASTKAVDLEAAMARAPGRVDLRQFHNIVDEMAIAAGLPRPKVYLVDDPDANAFATGRNPDHASIAVTEGLLKTLNRQQLQGVVAHEMSHIRNFDIRLMTIVAALVGSVALLSDWAARGWRMGLLDHRGSGGSRGGGKKEGANLLVLLVLVVWVFAILVAPIVSRLLAMTVSRKREFLADATAAELTRNPGALADALEVIEAQAMPTLAVKRGTAHLCIADPLGRPINEKTGFWANLMATHPPMHERIAALRAMAYQ